MISGKLRPLLVALLLSAAAEDLDTLKRRYESEKSKKAEERRAALVEIGRLKTEPAAEFLAGVFDKDADETVRRYALQALGACGTPNALKKLLGVAERTASDNEDRSAALDAAVSTGAAAAADLAAAILLNGQESAWIRERAGRTLSKHRPLEETEKIWRKVLNDPANGVRTQAFLALAPLKDSQVLSLARTALLDPKHAKDVRRAAVEPWKVKGDAAAVKLLLDVPIADDGALRGALVNALSKLSGTPAFDALVAQLPKARPEMRAVAAWALGKSTHEKAMSLLETLIGDREIDVRIAALEGVADRGGDEARAILAQAAQKGEDEAAGAAVGLLSKFTDDDTVRLLIRLAGQVDMSSHRVAIIDSLARIGSPEAFPIFEKWVACLEWPLRAASVRGLAKVKRIESVDLLITRMGYESGRILGDMAAALETLTGKSMGNNPEHWKAWWKINREKFSFDGAGREAEAGGRGTTTYHDIPVVSSRMIFLLDVSGSMRGRKGSSTRLGEAKAELEKVLRALPKETRVNLIFFSSRVDPWQPRLAPIGPNLATALAAVDALKAGGETNIHDSIEKALEDAEVDTIYLLSDGAPSTGKFTVAADVLREVRRMNLTRQVAIHAISLGRSGFMKQLAAENSGQYQEVK